jgi:hypothetical protein
MIYNSLIIDLRYLLKYLQIITLFLLRIIIIYYIIIVHLIKKCVYLFITNEILSYTYK